MESNKIVVDFIRVENVLIAKLVELPRKLWGTGKIISDGKYSIKSIGYTEITPVALYLGGTCEKCGTVSFTFTDEIEAEKALENFKHLIHEYNSCCEKDDTTIAWERAE